jgi:hypothetical protein
MARAEKNTGVSAAFSDDEIAFFPGPGKGNAYPVEVHLLRRAVADNNKPVLTNKLQQLVFGNRVVVENEYVIRDGGKHGVRFQIPQYRGMKVKGILQRKHNLVPLPREGFHQLQIHHEPAGNIRQV